MDRKSQIAAGALILLILGMVLSFPGVLRTPEEREPLPGGGWREARQPASPALIYSDLGYPGLFDPVPAWHLRGGAMRVPGETLSAVSEISAGIGDCPAPAATGQRPCVGVGIVRTLDAWRTVRHWGDASLDPYRQNFETHSVLILSLGVELNPCWTVRVTGIHILDGRTVVDADYVGTEGCAVAATVTAVGTGIYLQKALLENASNVEVRIHDYTLHC